MAKKFLKQYEILYIKAKEDFVAGKYLLDGFNNHNLELKLEIIFFHFQQCSEKLIKSLLDFKEIKFPHNHNIRELIKLANDNKILIENKDELSMLTQYAVEGRYLIIHDDLSDADKYVEILDKLLIFIESHMSIC